jgi:hypothetical protein
MQAISFFPRQVLAGTETSTADTYSEIYDVGSFSALVVELRVYTANPASAVIAVEIEQSMDPTFRPDSWSTLGTLNVTASGGAGVASASYSGPARFVRAKCTMPAASYATVHVEAVAREST